jgi:hypothetical protein
MGKVKPRKPSAILKRLFRGHPQRDYKRNPKEIDHIFTHLFPRWMPTSYHTISAQTGIPFQRLYDWRTQWSRDPTWRPYIHTFRGRHHRIFSDEEERHITEYIVQNYLLPGYLFTDATFRQIAIEAYLEKSKDNENPTKFDCSPHFITGFKERNRFSSRRVHLKRRPQVAQEARDAWIQKLADLLHEVPDHTRIINADESCWRVYPDALKTWARTGSQNISLSVDGNNKDSFTIVAAITAARTKLPLWMIAAGRTERVEASHFGDVGYHQTAHSETGWQTTDTFTQWLNWLRGIYDDGGPIWLILDCYSVHREAMTRQHAHDLGINLLFIPPGLTDELQPLDRFVFGAMKATCRRLYRMHCDCNPAAHMNQEIATAFLIRAWEGVSPEVMDDAWAIADPENEAGND